MASIYQGFCGSCEHETKHFPSERSAVIARSGSVVVLAHPGETRQLEKEGFSWSRARQQGRLISCRFFVCRQCGGLYEQRRIVDGTGGEGCLPALICSAIAGLYTAIVSDSLTLTFLTSSGVFLGVTHLIGRLVRWNWGRQRTEPPFSVEDIPCDCVNPDPEDLIRIYLAGQTKELFPCRACGESSTRFRHVGIS